MKTSLEIHSGDVNNDSGPSEVFIHFTPESLIHISPESLFTISRNDYSHAPEYAASCAANAYFDSVGIPELDWRPITQPAEIGVYTDPYVPWCDRESGDRLLMSIRVYGGLYRVRERNSVMVIP